MAFRYSSPLIIPDTSSLKEDEVRNEVNYIYNALRTLATQLDAVTGALSPVIDSWPTVSPIASILGNNINKFYCRVGVNIPYGAFVNFYNYSGTEVQARPAQANGTAKAAAGFCVTPGGFTAGSWGEFVVGPGVNYAISGMTPGTWYYLDPSSALGQITATQPSTPGQITQQCGIAITDTMLLTGSLNNWFLL